VTSDPRGVGRSPRADGATWATPDEHADDLYGLISESGAGPADIFASSGGGVNELALVTHAFAATLRRVLTDGGCPSGCPSGHHAQAGRVPVKDL
jgi:pimeloyl-ACP methyl ester carboxylesterase